MMEFSIPHSRPWIEPPDMLEVANVLEKGMVASGNGVKSFEKAVNNYLRSAGAVACSSGTSAITLALKTLAIGTGDEVIVPTYVCSSVLSAVVGSGAKANLCDVNESGVVTIQSVRRALTSRTKAIVAVHTFGHPCDVESLKKLELPVIEDACQAFGLKINGRYAGTLGTFGILSFHATKCLTTGEGGMLLANELSLLESARALLKSTKPNNATGTGAMSDIQAALGSAQLKRYPTFLDRRNSLFESYHSVVCGLTTAKPAYSGKLPFLFRFTLTTPHKFEEVQKAFLAFGIQSRRGVDELLHRRLGQSDKNYTGASKLFDSLISLPFYPSLSELEQNHILKAIKEVFNYD